MNKWLALIVFLFFIINVAANLFVPTEITPIYNWNLYANPLPDQKTYSFNVISYNGKELKFKHTWNEPKKVLLNFTMNLFIATQVEGKKDYSQQHFYQHWLPQHTWFQRAYPSFTNFPTQREFLLFPHWYKRYLAQHTGEQTGKIQVWRKTVTFPETGPLRILSSELIYTIQ